MMNPADAAVIVLLLAGAALALYRLAAAAVARIRRRWTR